MLNTYFTPTSNPNKLLLFFPTFLNKILFSNNNLQKMILWLSFLLLSLTYGQYTTIAVIGLNDIHGAALPTLMERTDNHQNYTYGGLQYMAGLINIIQE